MTDAQTEARAIARKVLAGIPFRNEVDIEAQVEFATPFIATALAAKDAELAEARSVHRWSVDDAGNGILHVCRNNHGKGDPCEWEQFVPIARAERAEAQLAEANKAHSEIIQRWLDGYAFNEDSDEDQELARRSRKAQDPAQ